MNSFHGELNSGASFSYDHDKRIFWMLFGLKDKSTDIRGSFRKELKNLKADHGIGVSVGPDLFIHKIVFPTPGPTADPTNPYSGIVEVSCTARGILQKGDGANAGITGLHKRRRFRQ